MRLVIASMVVLAVGCGSSAAPSLPPAAQQALRTCADRWNQSNMRDWGPAPAHLGTRRGRCVIVVGVDRGTSWTCRLNGFGAFACPLRHEPDRIPLRNENGKIDTHGVLTLEVNLGDTHAPRRLAWQRYPRADGYVEPWTHAGTLRSGLTLRNAYSGGGTCSPTFGSEYTPAKNATRCLWRGLYQVDPCFPPPGRWNRRGGVVACSLGPGSTTFGRFVIGPPSYRAVDFAFLEPWTSIGAISLDEPRAQVAHDYDAVGHRFHVQSRGGGLVQGYYVLHRTRVFVTFQGGRVNQIEFTTPYYRTSGSFGVGSKIAAGARWHGFLWDAWKRNGPCNCWVKVGNGARSLPATPANFLKPWVFLYVRHGRVTRIVMAQRFVD